MVEDSCLILERTYYMKKGTMAAVFLAVLSLLALGILTVYLTLYYKEETLSSDAGTAESEAEAILLTLQEAQTAALSASQSEKAFEETPVIWAGDSRTLGMQNAMKNDDVYIGASGEGYQWLSQIGLPQVKEAIARYPASPVVFNFGVNDYDNLEHYLLLYEALLEEYPNTGFYFLSVNPIDPAVCTNITNEEITDFNRHLQSSFSDAYLDSYTYLMTKEVIPIDGVHYSAEDYRLIYEYATEQIRQKLTAG